MLIIQRKILLRLNPSLSLSLISAGFSAGLEVRDQRERSWQFLKMCFSKMLLLQ
jgi:hypothetical protein